MLTALKSRLRSGRWRPGSRLPTRTELIKSLKISPMTLQRVIDELIREGFVCSRGRDGTFAADAPPFTRNFGFVINGPASARDEWVHYWRVLEAEAQKLFASPGREAKFYYGIDRPMSPDMDRLREDIEAQRLAGVFFSNLPAFLLDSPLVQQKHTPLVAVGSKQDGASGLSLVVFGTDRFMDKALKEVAAAGRKRVGLITPWEDPRQHVAKFQATAQRYGLETQPRWCQYAPHSREGRLWAAHAVEAIIGGAQRPDALVIYDDNHIESAMSGMLRAGCAVPGDCLVVAHTNFPWPLPSPFPLIRIGIDIRKVVESAVAEIERRQNGQAPQEIYIPLQTQNEAALFTARR
ncbi:MAG TPA: GntR family transcriptional regulator [Planctomycetota bacterium]|nr:GntR family transcriptional regulator [Planctomycetota bacterium]